MHGERDEAGTSAQRSLAGQTRRTRPCRARRRSPARDRGRPCAPCGGARGSAAATSARVEQARRRCAAITDRGRHRRARRTRCARRAPGPAPRYSPSLRPMNVTVSAARVAMPSTAPVSACRPEGMSTATIGLPRVVGRGDHRGRLARHRAGEAGADTAHRRSRRLRATPRDQGSQRPPAATKSCQAAARRPASRAGSPSATTCDAQVLRARHARHHVAVAAVVAWTAQHGDRCAPPATARASAFSVACPARVMSS